MTPSARALALAVALALPAIAGAQLYDPAFRWRTLETPHFRVHYHQGEEALAREVATVAERAHATLVPKLGHAPRARTEVVLSDDVDDANGSATPIPYATIRLYAVPPDDLSELNAYRDWVSSLVFHEYVHILHLDAVGGAPGWINAAFGRVWFPNGLVPQWMIEGLAVAHEADGEPGGLAGRNASALYEMYERAEALDPPGFPRLDQLSNPTVDWPVGNVPYLLGGRFMAFLEARYGQDAMTGFLRGQGSRLWPYAPSWTGERWFGGQDFTGLWADFAAAERARFEAQLAAVRARPVTHPVRLTHQGGRVVTPAWSPDGSFVAYYHRGLDRRPALRRVAPDGTPLRPLTGIEANGALALRSAREAVVAIGDVWQLHRVYDDLWLVDLETGARRRLTDGARATDPTIAPDGTLVYVRRTGPGRMALVRRALDGGPEEVLFERDGAQLYAPSVSPDGRRVAFALHADGRRDVVVREPDGTLTRVTDDAALDTDPAWTPDGRWLLFCSDRSGIYDLYAWEAATGRLRQVTNVESGAFHPSVSPDGRTIAFTTYGRAGYDVAVIPLEPSTWLDPAPAPAAGPAPALDPAATVASGPYDPWRTLRPTWWLPLWGSDAAGPILGAMTGGSDVLGRHAWALQAWWSVDGREPGYAASYVGGWSWPLLDLASARWLDSARAGRDLETVWTPLAAGLSFPFARLEGTLTLRLGWEGTRYDVLGAPAGTATRPEQLGRLDGFLSDLSFTATYSDARRFVRSISPEEGRTFSLGFAAAAPELGSDFGLARARGSVAQYLRVPGTAHDVLAVRLAGGVAHGSIGVNAPFQLGGTSQLDALSLVLGTIGPPGDQLRGYPYGWLEGTGYALANAELRLPIAVPERGWSTWPVFLRRLHGAVFADLGDAFDLPGELPFAGHAFAADRLRLGAGAELRAEVVLGYWVVTDVRLGIAHAFGQVFRGETQEPGVAPVNVYLTVGPSF